MPEFIFKNAVKTIEKKSKVLILGLTFKENVKDIRNSKSAVLENLFHKKGYSVDVYDPLADKKQALKEYGIKLVVPNKKYSCVIITVGHKEFLKMSFKKKIIAFFARPSLLIDIKNIWDEKNFQIIFLNGAYN